VELEKLEEKLQVATKEAMERTRKRDLEDLHTSKLKSHYNDDELDLLGVSVYHLQHYLMKEVHKAGFNEKSKIYEIVDLNKILTKGIVREKGANITCPMDGRKGASYVHSIIFEGENENDKDHYGKATVMLSYPWGYTIGDIINTLANYCINYNLDQKRTYVWICFLCVNQHRVVELKKRQKIVEFIIFRDIFERRVKGIGHLLPMISPWDNPGYLHRVWCLFELIIAKKYGCKITMIMPDSDRLDFLKMLDDKNMSTCDRMTRLFDVLFNTRVQDAKDPKNPT